MSLKDRTNSVWEHQVELPKYEALMQNEGIEICIIGGGISGVSIAYQLAKRGHKVMLVEAFRIASGQTGRTTAHLSCQLEEQFMELLKIHNTETVRIFYEAHKKAIDVIEEIAEHENISCDFKRLDGYLFQGKNFGINKLREEEEAARKVGCHLNFVQQTPILAKNLASLKFSGQAQFNPLKYMNGLLRVLKDLNVAIFEDTHVSDIRQEDGETWHITTERGFEINAKNLIVTTDSPVNNRFHIHTKQSAYRTYVVSFELKSPQHECLLWDTEDPYHYIRFVDNQMIVGGADHRTGQDPSHDPFTELEKWSREHFDFIGEVRERWSGQIFEPMDQIAFVGRNPGVENGIYISTGASGLGMTTGTIASMIIPDLIEKGTHPWEDVFDPGRSPFHGLKEFIKENANVAFQYRDWLTSSEVGDVHEIPEDSGSLMREGLIKDCIYHAQGEEFERKSAVCTHLGGIVHWNEVEKSWDCPCHGSRFNVQGKVIEGPALSDLSER